MSDKLSIITYGAAKNAGGSGGQGDMTKAVYDSNDDGIVDAADNANTVNNHSVQSDVPANAKFTDTDSLSGMTDTSIALLSGGQILEYDGTSGKWENSSALANKDNLKLASSGTTGTGEIRFGVDGNGNYGYIKAGADSVTPFKNPTGNKAIPQITQNGTVTGIDVEDYATASVIVNVESEYTRYIRKAWSGLTSFRGSYIWSDGNDIYYSRGTTQKILNKATSTWSDKTWSGGHYSGFDGNKIWSDGNDIYYSNGTKQYVLDKATSTWSAKTWNGLTSFDGDVIWSDGQNIYYSNGSTQKILDITTSTWSNKTWNGLTSFYGHNIWSDGNDIYYSDGTTQKVLNKATSTWSDKIWSGLDSFYGNYVWKYGTYIYYSYKYSHYVLNKATSTWSTKAWNYNLYYGDQIWSDDSELYYSYDAEQEVLNKYNETWYAKNQS